MNSSMTVTPGSDTRRFWTIAYWVFTLYVVLTAAASGVVDILQTRAVLEELHRLGYPPHFAPLLGTWKVLGAVALAAPRYRLLKEWAYAGMFIDFSGAVVAHASVGDGVTSFIGPVLAILALVASWILRPPSRRLPQTQNILTRLRNANER